MEDQEDTQRSTDLLSLQEQVLVAGLAVQHPDDQSTCEPVSCQPWCLRKGQAFELDSKGVQSLSLLLASHQLNNLSKLCSLGLLRSEK